MQQLKPIVAEIVSLGKDLDRQAAELKETAERSSLARILEQISAESFLIAHSLITAIQLDDGGTALRVMVPQAEEDALMAAALLMVASHDLLVFTGSLDLSQRIRALSDRMEAVMWKLEAVGKELPTPAPATVN